MERPEVGQRRDDSFNDELWEHQVQIFCGDSKSGAFLNKCCTGHFLNNFLFNQNLINQNLGEYKKDQNSKLQSSFAKLNK